MFTGLVQAVGQVARLQPDGHGGLDLTIHEPRIARAAKLGDSIAVNGACLTVVAHDDATLRFQLGPETVARTSFRELVAGQRVNLEPALRVGDAIGGHFVSGHVDDVGRLAERKPQGDWQFLRFELEPRHDELLVAKGSIAVQGVSLTIVDAESGWFSVMLIPHTLEQTTLGVLKLGEHVNLEFDMLAKHVRKLLKTMTITL